MKREGGGNDIVGNKETKFVVCIYIYIYIYPICMGFQKSNGFAQGTGMT